MLPSYAFPTTWLPNTACLPPHCAYDTGGIVGRGLASYRTSNHANGWRCCLPPTYHTARYNSNAPPLRARDGCCSNAMHFKTTNHYLRHFQYAIQHNRPSAYLTTYLHYSIFFLFLPPTPVPTHTRTLARHRERGRLNQDGALSSMDRTGAAATSSTTFLAASRCCLARTARINSCTFIPSTSSLLPAASRYSYAAHACRLASPLHSPALLAFTASWLYNPYILDRVLAGIVGAFLPSAAHWRHQSPQLLWEGVPRRGDVSQTKKNVTWRADSDSW